MGKEINYNMGKIISEMASKPLRSKQDAILLLLYTIRMFDVDEFLPENEKVRVNISINKMNRIFYILDNKIFSMQFPFCLEIKDEKLIRVYDVGTGIDITPVVISKLIGLFEKSNLGDFTLDSFFDEVMYSESDLQNVKVEQIWQIVKHISTYDLGYIRYDYDEEHHKELLHPLYHLDVCLDTAATYKIGLKKSITQDEFKDILDITTNCVFLQM